MKITSLEPLSKGRQKVYIDDELSFVLYRGELTSYQIKIGKEIEQETIDEIVGVVLTKRAKLRCMNLLQAREYTEWQLRKKMKAGFYPIQAEDVAVAYVKSYGYIDDVSYAKRYIDYYQEQKSFKRIEQDLQQKGIARESIKELLQEATTDESLELQQNQILHLLQKKGYSNEENDRKKTQKIAAYLLRKGFAYEDIRKAMKNLDVFEE